MLTVNKAVTLISLVITIIILIILAGVAINLSVGNNGIFTRTKQAKEKYIETQEREKLELILMEALAQRETDESFDKEETLNNLLVEQKMRCKW